MCATSVFLMLVTRWLTPMNFVSLFISLVSGYRYRVVSCQKSLVDGGKPSRMFIVLNACDEVDHADEFHQSFHQSFLGLALSVFSSCQG